MIDVVNYTCSECGTVCDVVQETGEVRSRPCGHTGVIHANLKGKLFGQGAIAHGMLSDNEIPAMHREAFLKFAGDKVVIDGGATKWWVRDWVEYIERFHSKTLPE